MLLHEIRSDLEDALNSLVIDEETGEIENFETISKIQADFEEKLEGYGCYIKVLKAAIEAFKNEEKALKERRSKLEKKLERFSEYVRSEMLSVNVKKIHTIKCDIGFRKSKETVIDSDFVSWASQNANHLLRYKLPEPDKAAIKKAIETGQAVEHAMLVEKENLYVR